MQLHKKIVLQAAMNQLAIDVSVPAEAFAVEENTVTAYTQHSGRRRFGKDSAHAFKIACFGRGAVLSGPTAIVPMLQPIVEGKRGVELFEFSLLYEIDRALRTQKLRYASTALAFLPRKLAPVMAPLTDASIRFTWYEAADMPVLYEYKGIDNAVGYDMNSCRPDVLAVAAFRGGELLGAAGASEDAENFWQIGIDVMPACRTTGLGTALVSMLSHEIVARGAVSYYCTNVGNVYSRNVAINCGYFPAWVEGYAEQLEQCDG